MQTGASERCARRGTGISAFQMPPVSHPWGQHEAQGFKWAGVKRECESGRREESGACAPRRAAALQTSVCGDI